MQLRSIAAALVEAPNTFLGAVLAQGRLPQVWSRNRLSAFLDIVEHHDAAVSGPSHLANLSIWQGSGKTTLRHRLHDEFHPLLHCMHRHCPVLEDLILISLKVLERKQDNCNQQKNHCEPTNKRRKKLKTIEPLCIQRQLSISVRCQNTKMEQRLSSKPDVKMCSGTSSKESGCGGAGAVPGSDGCPDSFFSFSTSCLISFASKMTTHVTHVACLSKSQRPYHYKSMFSFLKAQLSLTNSSIPPYSRASAAVLRFFKARGTTSPV